MLPQVDPIFKEGGGEATVREQRRREKNGGEIKTDGTFQ